MRLLYGLLSTRYCHAERKTFNYNIDLQLRLTHTFMLQTFNAFNFGRNHLLKNLLTEHSMTGEFQIELLRYRSADFLFRKPGVYRLAQNLLHFSAMKLNKNCSTQINYCCPG